MPDRRIDPPNLFENKRGRVQEPRRTESPATLPATRPEQRMCARVFKTANQSIPNGTTVTLTWQTEDFDTSGLFTTAQNTRLTVPGVGGSKATGMWLIHSKIEWQNIGTVFANMFLLKNGVTIAQSTEILSATGSVTQDVLFYDLDPKVGDFYEIQVNHGHVAAVNVLSDADGVVSYFQIIHLW